MNYPEPFHKLDERGLRAFRTCYAHSVAVGHWQTGYVVGASQLADCAVRYISWAEEVARVDSREERAKLEEYRHFVRDWMCDFYLIPLERARLGEMRADGLDRDIAELCGVSDGGRA
jgi:hypothetical protein